VIDVEERGTDDDDARAALAAVDRLAPKLAAC
jgi:hypothetical protein